MEENNKSNFVTSNVFKWILVAGFEVIGLIIMMLLLPKPADMHDPNATINVSDFGPLIIYVIVCIVISLGLIFKLNKKVDRYQKKNYFNDRRTENFIAGQTFGTYTRPDNRDEMKQNRIALVAALSVILSPFMAPYVLGTLVHTIICKVVEKK